jgi:tRNA threonylcarbamoyl adenosine modification protein YeaZ
MQILGIDSSTKNLSIGFSQDDIKYYGINFSKEAAFMVNIISCIDNVLKKAGKCISDIDAFSVNIGPGDFTGTRIGMSVAKTLALVEGKPIYGIEALDACAAGILVNNAAKISRLLQKKESVLLLPALDVKRNEVFFSIYEASLAGESLAGEETGDGSSILMHTFGGNNIFISKVSGDHLVDCENFSDELDRIFLYEPIIITVGVKPSVFASGMGFLSYKHLFKDLKKINYSFYLDSKSFYPDARFLNMCTYFRAVNEIKNRDLNTLAGSIRACEQIDSRTFKGKDIQLLEILQSGQTEIQQTMELSGYPIPKAEKSILAGDKNVIPKYVREFVPFVKKQDI